MKTTLFLLACAISLLSGCSGFQPVDLDHDDEKLDYREGTWHPGNS